MNLLIDRAAVMSARYVCGDWTDDRRMYYLIPVTGRPDALIVCPNELFIMFLINQVCVCRVGWDIAQPGLAPAHQVGQRRTKVTIYHVVRDQKYARTLTQLLETGCSPQPGG